jgi:hypothetical protein
MDDDNELRHQTIEDKTEDLELQDEAADQVGGGSETQELWNWRKDIQGRNLK